MSDLKQRCEALLKSKSSWLKRYLTEDDIATYRHAAKQFLKGDPEFSAEVIEAVLDIADQARRDERRKSPEADPYIEEKAVAATTPVVLGQLGGTGVNTFNGPATSPSDVLGLVELGVKRFAAPQQKKAYKITTSLGGKPTSSKAAAKYKASKNSCGVAFRKARTTGIAGAILVAAETQEEEQIKVLLSEEFGKLAPFRADVLGKFDDLKRRQKSLRIPRKKVEKGLEKIWHCAVREIIRTAKGQSYVDQADVRILQACFVNLFMIARWGTTGFRHVFDDSYSDFRQAGILENRHMARHIATIGTYCGNDTFHLDFLNREESALLEPIGTSVFAAGGSNCGIPIVKIYNGDAVRVSRECINNKKLHVALSEYLRTCLGTPLYYQSGLEGIAWMLLRWATYVADSNDDIELKKVAKLMRQYRNRFCVSPDLHNSWSKIIDTLS